MPELFHDFRGEVDEIIVSCDRARRERILSGVSCRFPVPLNDPERVSAEVVADEVFPAGLGSRPVPDSIGVLASESDDARLSHCLADLEVERQADVVIEV